MDYETGMIVVTILLAISEIIPFIPWIPGGGILQTIIKGVCAAITASHRKETK